MSDHVNHNCATVGAAVSAARHDLAGDTPAATEAVRHVYVHIPFCARICPYCAFYKDLLDRSQTQRFCQAIICELQSAAASQPSFNSNRRSGERGSLRLVPSTIYFGGGTPTALSIKELEFILRGFCERLDLAHLAEWTFEANPGSVSARKAALMRRCGVNRVSLGVQSWDEGLLKLLGRDHNARQVEESFRILRDAGFSNINVDLMFGLPGQTLEQWRSTLEKTIALQPEHISTYCLTYEEDTEFFRRHAQGEFGVDEESEAELFERTMSILQEAGYAHYEISNYARPGFESVHNRAYWTGEDYLGVGPSAFSTIGTQRWQNVCDYRGYADRVLRGESPIGSVEKLTSEMKRTEQIALGLRTRDGLSADLLASRPDEIEDLVALRLLKKSNGNFVLTQKGKLLADSVAEAVISG
jgi:oxygen-independent coproporphyrinogen-3 oxidase